MLSFLHFIFIDIIVAKVDCVIMGRKKCHIVDHDAPMKKRNHEEEALRDSRKCEHNHITTSRSKSQNGQNCAL